MHVDSFVNSQMDFQNIRSLLETVANFQQNLYIYIYMYMYLYNTFHHTFSVLPHYFAKIRSSSLGISGKNANERCNMH